MSSDDQLVRKLAQNSRNSGLWAELYDLLQPHLKLFTYSLVSRYKNLSPEDVNDIVQDVLLNLVRDFDQLKSRIESFAHLQNYLLKACRNGVANRLRHISVREGAREFLILKFSDVVSEGFAKAFDRVENRKLIDGLLERMNHRCQKLIRFYLLEDKTLVDYALAEGLKAGTVYSQWHRCLAEMRHILEEHARNSLP